MWEDEDQEMVDLKQLHRLSDPPKPRRVVFSLGDDCDELSEENNSSYKVTSFNTIEVESKPLNRETAKHKSIHYFPANANASCVIHKSLSSVSPQGEKLTPIQRHDSNVCSIASKIPQPTFSNVVRPTPDSRAFQRPTQLKRKLPVCSSSSSSIKTKSYQSRASPFHLCPPTPHRNTPRDRTPGSRSHQNRMALSEPKVLFNSPYRNLSVGDSSLFSCLSSPEELPQIEYSKAIGHGTSSVVYRVKNTRDGKYYAVKKFKESFVSIKARDRALSEATSWLEVGECPYIVPLYRAWQENGHLYLMMYLCEGGTLQEYVEQIEHGESNESCGESDSSNSTAMVISRSSSSDSISSMFGKEDTIVGEGHHNRIDSRFDAALEKEEHAKLCAQQEDLIMPNLRSASKAVSKSHQSSKQVIPDEVIWRCMHDIAQALRHIHERGLVHNDLKPSNFYVGNPSQQEGYRILLGDFGQISKISQLGDGDEGDAVYMAQEVLQGICEPSNDMFSFGLSMYEMAAQVVLPENGHMWHQLRNGNVPSLSCHRSRELNRVICLLLHPDPAQRPTANMLLSHKLIQQNANYVLRVTSSQEFLKYESSSSRSCSIVHDVDTAYQTFTSSCAANPPQSVIKPTHFQPKKNKNEPSHTATRFSPRKLSYNDFMS